MLRYVLRRVLYAVPILIGVSIVTFIVFYATSTPEQMARRNLSAKNPTQAQIQEWIVEHGYDKPRREQFVNHMKELFLLRFGKSDTTGQDIWERIRQGAGPSGYIASLIFIGSLIASLSFALLVAYFRGTYLDVWATFLCVLLMSINYLIYIIAGQYVLSKLLKLFPLGGWRSGADAWRFVLLPVAVGVITGLGSSVRLYRTFMLEEINQDYVRTARAKGLKERAILLRHVLKNAAIPVLTSVAAVIPLLILGGLLIESFFGIPGLGSLTVDAINSQDFAVVRAMVFLGSLLYIVGLILTDVAYALFDPRVRLE